MPEEAERGALSHSFSTECYGTCKKLRRIAVVDVLYPPRTGSTAIP